MKEPQVYKWFWDTKKKVEEDEQFAQEMGETLNLVHDEQSSQTVKKWRQMMECQGMEGWDALGAKLTPLQIKNGFRLHKIAEEKPEDYDLLAQELNLNIDEDALDLIEEHSPTCSRQILRR